MADITRINTKRTFTLAEAREMLPVVRRLTSEAVKRVDELTIRYESLPDNHEDREPLERELNEVINQWGEKVQKLGAEAKGLWLVDFDNGEGYYCWRWPEPGVDHYHEYEGGFAGRTPIN